MKMSAKRFISVLLSLTIVFAVCPFAYAQKETLACGHSDYTVTIHEKKATCEDYGYSEQRECNVCSYILKAKYVTATGHNYLMDESSIGPDGVLYRCVGCGDTYAKEHRNWSYLLLEKKPTCTESGHTAERICKDCGYHEESVYLPAGNHELVVVEADKAKHTVQCTKCDYKAIDENHNSVFVYDGKGNCYTQNATGKKQCSVCEYVTEDNITVSGGIHQNITVKNEGNYELHVCDDCGYAQAKAIEGTRCACGLSVNKDEYIIKQPTCDKPGYLAYNCYCGKQKVIPVSPMGHELTDDYILIQQATCQQSGVKSKLCMRCDHSEDIELGKVPHKYIVLDEGIPVTCEQDGLTDAGYCLYCHEITDKAVIPATGHNLIDYNGEQFCTNCYNYIIDTDDGTVACKCLCHNHDGLSQTIFKFILFFAKLFGIMQGCDCGAVHYEK